MAMGASLETGESGPLHDQPARKGTPGMAAKGVGPMLFARAYLSLDASCVSRLVEEDVQRRHSYWAGKPVPSLSYEPGTIQSVEEAVALPPMSDSEKSFLPPCLGQVLPGLCACAVAPTYAELAQEIWRDYFGHSIRDRWSRRGTVVIFEGEPVETDPDGNPLFRPNRVLLIADVKAIARQPDC